MPPATVRHGRGFSASFFTITAHPTLMPSWEREPARYFFLQAPRSWPNSLTFRGYIIYHEDKTRIIHGGLAGWNGVLRF